MAEARFLPELHETTAEVHRFRERLSVARPVVHKDLSLDSLVPRWSGSKSSFSLEVFSLASKRRPALANGKTGIILKSQF